MKKLSTSIIILQFVAIVILAYTLILKSKQDDKKEPHDFFQPTICSKALDYAKNYYEFIKKTDSLNSEHGVLKIRKDYLQKVINSSPSNVDYIVGVFGRKDSTNTFIMFPVNSSNRRLPIYYNSPTLPSEKVDEMYPGLFYIKDLNPDVYNYIFNCPSR